MGNASAEAAMTTAGGAAEDRPGAPPAITHEPAAEVLYEGAECNVDMRNAAEAPEAVAPAAAGVRPPRLADWAINIEALCAAPLEAFAHSPSQMPLSCPVAPPSQRELHKDRAAAVVAWRGGHAPPGPETQVLRHVLWHVLHNALRRVVYVLVLHVSPKGRRVWGGLASGSPRAAA